MKTFTFLRQTIHCQKLCLRQNQDLLMSALKMVKKNDQAADSQCVTFLHRAAEKPAPAAHAEFTDVEAGRYFYDAISWAAEKGITVGLNDGTGRFGVGQKCTRGMLVTFLYRFAVSK